MFNFLFDKEYNCFYKNTDEEVEALHCSRYEPKLVAKRQAMGEKEVAILKHQRLALLAEVVVRDMKKSGDVK